MNGMAETWLRLGASLAIGLLIGLERERHPEAKAGVRTFALVALFGTLSTVLGALADAAWTVPIGLAIVASMLIVAHARSPVPEEPGTTTVVVACVCFLLGALAGAGDSEIAGALAIGVTALLYFKPEIEGISTALKRHEQVSILQFLVASFIVMPMLPDRGYGPYQVLNPRNIWLMVVLVSGIGLASHVALRLAGERRGALLAGLLGGLVSSTATTVLYARRSSESEGMQRFAQVAVPLANLVPLGRIALIAVMIAPAILADLVPVIGASFLGGALLALVTIRGHAGHEGAPMPESRNPAELGTALRFGAFYGAVLLAAAWLADVAGPRGLYAAAAASGIVDIDAIMLSAFNLFIEGHFSAHAAVNTVSVAFATNVLFKVGVLAWYNRHLAWRTLWPFVGMLAGGGAALVFL